jgi:hypothetical protein
MFKTIQKMKFFLPNRPFCTHFSGYKKLKHSVLVIPVRSESDLEKMVRVEDLMKVKEYAKAMFLFEEKPKKAERLIRY